jgi:hypothetical protein
MGGSLLTNSMEQIPTGEDKITQLDEKFCDVSMFHYHVLNSLALNAVLSQ